MLVFLPIVALAGTPELSLTAGKSVSPFTDEIDSDQRFLGVAVRAPLGRRLHAELREVVFAAPTERERRVLSTVVQIFPDSPWMYVPTASWASSASLGWASGRGRVSIADEAVLDLEIHFRAGAAFYLGNDRTVRYDPTIAPPENPAPLSEPGRVWAAFGPTAAVVARSWVSERTAIDVEVRETAIEAPLPAMMNEGDVPERAWRDHGALALSVTTLWGGRRADRATGG